MTAHITIAIIAFLGGISFHQFAPIYKNIWQELKFELGLDEHGVE